MTFPTAIQLISPDGTSYTYYGWSNIGSNSPATYKNAYAMSGGEQGAFFGFLLNELKVDFEILTDDDPTLHSHTAWYKTLELENAIRSSKQDSSELNWVLKITYNAFAESNNSNTTGDWQSNPAIWRGKISAISYNTPAGDHLQKILVSIIFSLDNTEEF